jgi:RNA polymerase sigma factor (sigma-70 family)
MAMFRDERDEAAFQALYDYARARLLVWIASLIGPRRREPDPLEVLQDAFVNIYRYAGTFRDEDVRSFRVWSRTIAGNLVRRARQPRIARSLDALPEGVGEPVDTGASPAEELVRGEDARAMARAWLIVLLQYAAAYEKLSTRDRLALDMIEVQGLSYAEAGKRLRVGVSNMKMIMFRSRRRIRAIISQRLSMAVNGETELRLARPA